MKLLSRPGSSTLPGKKSDMFIEKVEKQNKELRRRIASLKEKDEKKESNYTESEQNISAEATFEDKLRILSFELKREKELVQSLKEEKKDLNLQINALKKRVIREIEKVAAANKVTNTKIPVSLQANINLRNQYKAKLDLEREKYLNIEEYNRKLVCRIKELENDINKKSISMEAKHNRSNAILYWQKKHKTLELENISLKQDIHKLTLDLEKQCRNNEKLEIEIRKVTEQLTHLPSQFGLDSGQQKRNEMENIDEELRKLVESRHQRKAQRTKTAASMRLKSRTSTVLKRNESMGPISQSYELIEGEAYHTVEIEEIEPDFNGNETKSNVLQKNDKYRNLPRVSSVEVSNPDEFVVHIEARDVQTAERDGKNIPTEEDEIATDFLFKLNNLKVKKSKENITKQDTVKRTKNSNSKLTESENISNPNITELKQSSSKEPKSTEKNQETKSPTQKTIKEKNPVQQKITEFNSQQIPAKFEHKYGSLRKEPNAKKTSNPKLHLKNEALEAEDTLQPLPNQNEKSFQKELQPEQSAKGKSTLSFNSEYGIVNQAFAESSISMLPKNLVTLTAKPENISSLKHLSNSNTSISKSKDEISKSKTKIEADLSDANPGNFAMNIDGGITDGEKEKLRIAKVQLEYETWVKERQDL
ncbi:hypothetical protein HK098_005403 [Nowakowskiella sp. JEL0407]|nr:hypothetical protein HK098_005403 [Nowakowskiella sp. JEL0407]